VIYSLVNNSDKFSGYFTVNASTGEIGVIRQLDYESLPDRTVVLTVMAVDSQLPSLLYDTTTVTVDVTVILTSVCALCVCNVQPNPNLTLTLTLTGQLY